jgi:hypothetical protein
MNKINLWNAIAEMRKLTAQGIPFSFSHATWDRSRNISHGIRQVDRALLRPAAKSDDLSFADQKLFYEDLNISDPEKAKRNCWQILITSFNGISVTPKKVFYENL